MWYILLVVAIIVALVLAIYFFMKPAYATTVNPSNTVASTGGSGRDGPSQQEKNEPLIIIKPLTEQQRFDRLQLEDATGGIVAYFK